jgi:hypothetical protein
MHAVKQAAFALAAAVSSACGGGDGGAPEAPLAMFKSLGSLQCSGGGASLPALERQLLDAGVQVLAASCGLDGNAYIALCGAPDGRIGVFDLAAQHAAVARALGFAPLSDLPAAVRVPCT